ncbi:phytanoyl-CoA dioxygenase family protein [Kushneria aurantia]|uniref:Phytanoyl-CoA dioxygenase family protein n=1 Tax=Kushneria aurantia TaxID=504092 RepID=A0ABV6FZR3_9GAMM|nr:phytanoyl-CoA dioxygenase family protein [Kushneria aurantia]
MLSTEQIDRFHRDGYLVVENVFNVDELEALNNDFENWLDASRHHCAAYGETLDHRPRFDVGGDHSPAHPSLRRVSSPTEISDAYLQVAADSKMADMVFEIIGAGGVRLHHSKINAKLPGTETQVKWHQDFLFTPHSNDDLITALLMIGDVTTDNGPLQVIPGSHRQELYSHWQDERFTGTVDSTVIERECAELVECTGPAGSVCFMHTRLLHASAPNASAHPRTLFIVVYSAEDALPYGDNPLPSRHQGMLVRGHESGLVRTTPNVLRLPQKPSGASFFVQQAGQDIPA